MSESKKKQRAPRLSRANAAELLKEYEASGLSRVVFCAQRGIGMTTLGRYFRWRSEETAAARQRWVSVEVAPKKQRPVGCDSKLWIKLANGRRIEVSPGFDGAMVEKLVQLLERV